MKQLESMYDLIFEDKKLQQVFLNIHSSNWDKLTIKEKQNVIKQINGRVAALYGYEICKIRTDDSANCGSQNSFTWEISLSNHTLENYDGYEVIDTYFHELRHAFQHRAVQNRLTDKEIVSEDNKNKWKRNFLPQNYFGGDSDYYAYQSVELDAWVTGLLFARKIYFMNKKVIKEEDPKWEEYCSKHRSLIMTLVSDCKEAKKVVEENEEEIDRIYATRSDSVEQLEKGIEYAHTILKDKKIEELSFEEIAILMSPYAFPTLDTKQSVAVAKRYSELVKVGDEEILVKENTVGSIKVGELLHGIDNAYGLANDILTINYKRIVELIINDMDVGFEVNDTMRNELKLNMYKDKKGKHINYISDMDNLLLYSVQPIAKYESAYVLNEFKKLKDAELKAYGTNSSVWSYWERMYDNTLIFKTFARLVDMPFSEYYKKQLKEYKANIAKDINRR